MAGLTLLGAVAGAFLAARLPTLLLNLDVQAWLQLLLAELKVSLKLGLHIEL